MFLFLYFSEAVYSTIKLEYDENGNLCNNEPKCQPDEIEYTVDQTLWPDHCVKVEKILKDSLDSIPSPSVKIHIMGGRVLEV